MDPSDLVLNSIQHGVFNVVADRDFLSPAMRIFQPGVLSLCLPTRVGYEMEFGMLTWCLGVAHVSGAIMSSRWLGQSKHVHRINSRARQQDWHLLHRSS